MFNNFQRCVNSFLKSERNYRNQKFLLSLPGIEESQNIIIDNLTSSAPSLLLRFGLYEHLLCYQYLEKKCGLREEYSEYIKYHISMDAGIFDNNEKNLDKYCEFIISNLNLADIMAYWRDIPRKEIFGQFYSDNISHIFVEYLYPFPFWHNDILPFWQKELKDKTVLVVSSFSETISRQYKNRDLIWKQSDNILPRMNLLTYQSIVTNGGQTDNRFIGWEQVINHMINEIMKLNFDIVLISCGGYGMPLAISLRKEKKSVIQWGGCFQLWFGIMGGRWISDYKIKPYINKNWTFPSELETPPLANMVNNSSYWSPKIFK